MNLLTRGRTLIAGIAIILVVNAIALGGVAYNRSGTPESTLHLSQRELSEPYVWQQRDAENSGIALTLRWRVLRQFDETDENAWAQIAAGAYEHDPAWLDAAKLKSLGFDIAPLMSVGMEDQGHLDRSELSLEVFLVLELNGPAYQRALAQTRRIAASERPSIDSAKHYLMEEEQNNSRLFVVDAGLDAGALRVKYPDRSHYAIVRGRVRPQWSILAKKSHLSGNIDRMSIDTINVPLGFRPIFMSKSGKVYNSDDENNSHPFEAVVAFGKRFEPWIIDASGK